MIIDKYSLASRVRIVFCLFHGPCCTAGAQLVLKKLIPMAKEWSSWYIISATVYLAWIQIASSNPPRAPVLWGGRSTKAQGERHFLPLHCPQAQGSSRMQLCALVWGGKSKDRVVVLEWSLEGGWASLNTIQPHAELDYMSFHPLPFSSGFLLTCTLTCQSGFTKMYVWEAIRD
jgi:hypothetical protein